MKAKVRRASAFWECEEQNEKVEFHTLEELLEWIDSYKEDIIISSPTKKDNDEYTLMIYDDYIE